MNKRLDVQALLHDPDTRQALHDTATAGVISRLTRTPHTIPTQIDYDTRHKTIQNMEKYGGGFCEKLAQAWYAADVRNKQRIEAAFPDYILEYGPGGSFWRTEVRAEGVDPGVGGGV
jgi:hypothetical protein